MSFLKVAFHLCWIVKSQILSINWVTIMECLLEWGLYKTSNSLARECILCHFSLFWVATRVMRQEDGKRCLWSGISEKFSMAMVAAHYQGLQEQTH